jgi:hypothetical protein
MHNLVYSEYSSKNKSTCTLYQERKHCRGNILLPVNVSQYVCLPRETCMMVPRVSNILDKFTPNVSTAMFCLHLVWPLVYELLNTQGQIQLAWDPWLKHCLAPWLIAPASTRRKETLHCRYLRNFITKIVAFTNNVSTKMFCKKGTFLETKLFVSFDRPSERINWL